MTVPQGERDGTSGNDGASRRAGVGARGATSGGLEARRCLEERVGLGARWCLEAVVGSGNAVPRGGGMGPRGTMGLGAPSRVGHFRLEAWGWGLVKHGVSAGAAGGTRGTTVPQNGGWGGASGHDATSMRGVGSGLVTRRCLEAGGDLWGMMVPRGEWVILGA
ncbi:hypothetical protein H5410_006769 [Solanum commersonii]|uniref:Uncharacterized protein n=1 Tax=Solanum commersonii TaxID=4109 RepID=A0A9J6AC94_SOLCO|nr:hypothetical protein H5410_006769 [Solanum commersonii]